MRRRLALLFLSAVLGCLAAVMSALPASAGGPTTMVLSSMNLERATALFYSDSEFQDLAALLGAGEAGTPTAPVGVQGEFVTVTWLMYDGEIGRVDKVYSAGAEPWIWTQVRYSSERTARQGLWRHPENGAALVGLLNRLVLAPVTNHSDGSDRPVQNGLGEGAGSTVDVAGRDLAPATATSRVVAGPDFRGWPFALIGVAAGVALTLLAGLGLAAFRRRSADDDVDHLAPLPVLMLGDG